LALRLFNSRPGELQVVLTGTCGFISDSIEKIPTKEVHDI
jgi:hypothetical protein